MLFRQLEIRLRDAVAAVFPDADLSAVQVKPCPDTRFGDYQTSSLMALAKQRRLNPRQIAADVIAKLDVAEWCEPPEIAGPGFINFRLKTSAIESVLDAVHANQRELFTAAEQPRTFVIDFSSPNVAKPMHVGHIRSTLLGDCLARVLRFLGHTVVTDNHIGDWGTQFGKLLVGWKTQLDRAALEADPIGEMERLYKTVNAACDTDPSLLDQARNELVKLQAGDEENLSIWREMQALSQSQFDEIYGRLGVRFDHALGESFYNDRLASVVADLVDKGIARESEGALCVFSDGEDKPENDPFRIRRDGEWSDNPALVRKSDGAANYMTTDLATVAHRLETWNPDEIIYVTDGRQQLHFRQLFAIVRRWKPDAAVKLSHVWFGSILGEDGKPFKTRSGETVKLANLLDEAEERALAVVTEKNPELSDAVKREVARMVGIGAIKYADLSPNRQSDYIFSWDKMLALQGNTAPYLLYACTRVRSIFRKAAESGQALDAAVPLTLREDDELALARHLLNFGLVLESVVEDYRPNYLCTYLYELAGHYARFYENCPVLKADEPDRSRRLKLCELTGRALEQGLNLLGLETPEQM